MAIGWSPKDYTPFNLMVEPTHSIKEIRAEYTRQRDILQKRASRMEQYGLPAQAEYLRDLMPKKSDIAAREESALRNEIAALRKKGKHTEASRLEAKAPQLVKSRTNTSIAKSLAEGVAQGRRSEYSLKGLRQLQRYFEEQTGEEIALGDVLEFNEFMKSWRLSAFSKNYVLSGEAVSLYSTDYQEVGGSFAEFYSISYLYGT